MATEQLPDGVREFTDHLRGLLARLDRYTGWCLVFWQRDPDGMRACVEGRELPPWDVVESLLQDLAAVHGPAAAEAELPRARLLHAEATAAFDARPGARQALRDRLDVMLREQRYAADRRADLTHRLASAAGQEDADALAADLAWAEDDHRRATARCAELTARVTALDAATQGAGSPHPQGRPRLTADTSTPSATQVHDPSPSPAHRHAGAGPHPAREGRGPGPAPGAPQPGPGPDAATGVPGPETPGATALHPLAGAPEPHPSAPLSSSSPQPHPLAPDPIPPELRAAQQHVPAPPPSPAENTRPAPTRKRRRGGARFAGAEDDGAQPLVAPPAAVPELPAVTAARGARFAGAAEQDGPAEPPPRERIGADDVREVGRLVHTLTRLRREARSGEAHALLNQAAYWPAVRFPLLADAMERAGLAADWATLLWEAAATLPAERLVAAADALTAGGRAEDGEQILRQGVVRPADEIGHAALALADGTRNRELRALLDACVRTRTPQDAARTAAPDPGRLVPLLLTAARAVSEERHWDVLHALRVAGLAA
ncbi:hypothetical protein AB0H30_16860 [Streptomyces pseudogriseolus]|uniref:hypothetical protein n=1 Tax=Streptomyces pseudogriseolus TaxID=36817 RepID=UPI00349B2633